VVGPPPISSDELTPPEYPASTDDRHGRGGLMWNSVRAARDDEVIIVSGPIQTVPFVFIVIVHPASNRHY